MSLVQYPGLQVRGGEVTEVEDTVCLEETFRLFLNDEPLADLVASTNQLKELGVGFVLCEGLAEDVDSVDIAGKEIRVYAADVGVSEWTIGSCGGVGTKRAPKHVHSALTIQAQEVPGIIAETQSEEWKKTGAVHSSVLFGEGRMLVRSTDVGRHNTVDKVVGYAALNHIPLAQCVLGCTGRQPAAMVAKAANAGIPIVISKSASTYQGILMAYMTGITLVCFARGERYTVYTHPYRLTGLQVE
jgi:FdhD protein